jgi:hypothetical protein
LVLRLGRRHRVPADAGYNSATPFVVAASGGNRTVVVDQRADGGRWVSLGTFPLADSTDPYLRFGIRTGPVEPPLG